MKVRIAGPPRRRGLPAVDRRLLRSRARRMLEALGEPRAELSVALMDDAEIARLNSVWMGKGRPTDVLSFSLVEGEGAEHRRGLLGDVAIGVETAARQARARRRCLDDEVARLLVHGTLHLLGFDHRRAGEARAMRAEERRLWRALGEASDGR
jgi:probable rRNA maturation factor